MENAFLIGDKVYLRGLEHKDLTGEYFQWLNDYEVTRSLESGRTPNTVEDMEEYYASKTDSPNDVIFAIVEMKTNRHIGTVKLGSIDWVHRFADFAIMIGVKECWGRGYGTEAAQLSIDYGFRRLNLHKFILGVVADNMAAIRSYEKVGFRREGLVKQLLFVDGEYRDKAIMGLSRDDFYGQSEGVPGQ